MTGKLCSVLLACLLLFSLSGCGEGEMGQLLSGLEDTVASLKEVVEALPTGTTPAASGSVYEEWHPLIGYWQAAEERYFVLDMADSHSACFGEGLWATSYSRSGPVEGLTQSGEGLLTGTVHFPALEGNEMEDPRPAREVALTVDYSDREQDGRLRITVDGETFQCAYAGATWEEAYRAYESNRG